MVCHEGDNFGKKEFSYEDKCDYFLELLHRLLLEGKVKLGNHGEFLHGSVEEQILLFRKRFPNTQDEIDAGAFDGYWFFLRLADIRSKRALAVCTVSVRHCR
ncbi:DUF596 domain-containing protein [Serratia rubidaea]|uniref:DUF596 domain-containing protein n=1 Tax=Serratia rubidaea TaxID=61652 RepID=UPI0024322CF5|nr:DUF596 domain-containing protein [Serratia rubidaea]MCR1000743.1 DUF596 domain-containing protein [Serratia rubidaea]